MAVIEGSQEYALNTDASAFPTRHSFERMQRSTPSRRKTNYSA